MAHRRRVRRTCFSVGASRPVASWINGPRATAEAVSLALEQNNDGELVEIGGIQVYKSSNIEKNRFVWIDGMSVYSLTTTCDAEEVEAIISSFETQ